MSPRRTSILEVHGLQFADRDAQRAFWLRYNGTRRRQPAALADVARQLLADERQGPAAARKLMQVDDAWRSVVPPHLSAESRVESLRGGRLTIRVASAATRYVLARNLARTIPDALRAKLPDIRISRIDYIIGSLDQA